MVCVSERENPARPGPLHLAYTLAVSGVTGSSQLSALCAYTTSQPWPGGAMPLGVRAFDRQEATSLGQARPFVMDLRRLAFVPIAPAWFPQLDLPGGGIQGHAPKALQRPLMQTATELLTRRRRARGKTRTTLVAQQSLTLHHVSMQRP